MSAVLIEPKRHTVGEYLETEARTGERHEYFNGTILPMPGGSISHNRITANLVYLLKRALDTRSEYDVFSGDQKIYLPKLNYYLYPDAVVVAKEPILSDKETFAIINPLIIIEVLSPSTEKYDRGQKFMEFGSLESLREYLLIRQDAPELTSMFREEPGRWVEENIEGLNTEWKLKAIPDVSLSLSEIYKRVFPMS